ncbi:MAG: XTP/dITP diphosphatase [Candidatus Marinimicrobia bacterium]|nr:XTP/dITP diphosphatase [Candidatus Neomarinimicrobiota bacterium]
MIVIATHNRDKEKELRAVLRDFPLEVKSLDHFPEIGDIEETGLTLMENAKIKAETVQKITQLPSLGDDTGLEVDALNGAPGVYSSRFAGEDVTYEENVKKLLNKLESVPIEKRTARFRTVIYYTDGKRELYSEGEIKGIITEKQIGKNGFGYDPVFYIPELKKTMAELSPEEKNKLSHRGQAMRKLRKLLLDIIP